MAERLILDTSVLISAELGHLDLISATALATGRTVLTTDTRAGFHQLPGVSARLLTQ